MKLLIATNNQHKLAELKSILQPYFEPILSLKEAGIVHETVEDGETFAQNAHKKAFEINMLSGLAVLADDSGLEVDALFGAPGIYSARYAGENTTDIKNTELLLKNLEKIPQGKRTARFVCVLSLILPNSELTATGEIEGEISFLPEGQNGFGYDPVFYLPDYGCTFAQLEPEIKNRISHRACAVQELVKQLKAIQNRGEL